MSKLLGSDRNLKEVEVGGKVHRQQKDGTFHVDPITARALRKTGDFATVGTVLRTSGYRCRDCGFHAVFSDHCGRCDGGNMETL